MREKAILNACKSTVAAHLLFVALGCAGCTQSNGVASSDAGAILDGAADAEVHDPSGCMSDPRAQHYAPGMTADGAGGKIKLTLVSADVVPPLPGPKTWVVRVTDPNGAALNSPTIAVTPWMPDHNHGTPIRAVVTAEADGSFQVKPIEFAMPGLWESIFKVTTADGTNDTASFMFCIGSLNAN